LIRFSFHDKFSKFCIKMCNNLCHGMLELAENWLKFGLKAYWERLFPSVLKKILNLITWETSHLI
jgi:hypothetical protein